MNEDILHILQLVDRWLVLSSVTYSEYVSISMNKPIEDKMQHDLHELATGLALAKITEQRAREARIAIEEQIAALVPGPESGQKTVKLGDGTSITVKRGLNYKADLAEIENLFCQVPDLPCPVKLKTIRELDERGYEWYKGSHPMLFEAMAHYVTVTPKKVSVEIKVKVK